MRVLLLGSQTKAVLALRRFLASRHQVVAVVTQPDSNELYETIWTDSVAALASELGLPCRVRGRFGGPADLAWARDLAPDVMALCNWRTRLAPEAFGLPPFGTVNVHESLLPRYAGFSPVLWAMINGESEVGVTTHRVDQQLDAGDIIFQQRVPLPFDVTAAEILGREIYPLMAELLLASIDALEEGRAPRVPQDRSRRSFYHKRAERDGLIDWSRDPLRIYNLVRAQADPYPNAFTSYKGRRLYVKRASLPAGTYNGTPGRLFTREEHGVVVVCGEPSPGANQGLVLETVAEEGGEPLPGAIYFDRMGGYLGP